ncbi:hypothetical protein Hanom_Chr07g00605101 [Helianthus anomalus]
MFIEDQDDDTSVDGVSSYIYLNRPKATVTLDKQPYSPPQMHEFGEIHHQLSFPFHNHHPSPGYLLSQEDQMG